MQNKMREKIYANQKKIWLIVIIGFILTLYWVGFSPWGSREIAQYNDGYGTFDMKKYDTATVSFVLANMEPEGFHVSYRYYIGDYVFVLFFGLLQCMILTVLYGGIRKKNKSLSITYLVAILISILRGIFDMIENALLLATISSYPSIDDTTITVASFTSQCKMWCIKIWSVCVILGIIYVVIDKVTKKEGQSS